MKPFTFSVAGTPRPQPRPRFVGGRVISTTSPKAKLWRQGVAKAVKAAVIAQGSPPPLFTGPVRVRMVFTFQPPPSAPERLGTPHAQVVDCDNISKNVLDEMQKAGVFRNDSQAAQAPPEKWWGARPGVAVVVESLEGVTRVEPSHGNGDAPDWLRAAR